MCYDMPIYSWYWMSTFDAKGSHENVLAQVSYVTVHFPQLYPFKGKYVESLPMASYFVISFFHNIWNAQNVAAR